MNHRRESPQEYSMPVPEPYSEGLERRRCVRDLVTLSALPAMWKGYEPGRIAESAGSALVSMLDAEFVYIGLTGEGDNEIDVVKTAEPVEATRLRKIAAAVKLEIRDAGGRETITTSEPFFCGAFRLAVAPIGLDAIGVIVAGAQPAGFPTETQRLRLTTAANNTALGLLRWQSETEMRRFDEHERLDSRLRAAHLELGPAARLSSAGQIAAALAHELNQPLTAIANSLGAFDFLEKPYEDKVLLRAIDAAFATAPHDRDQQALDAVQRIAELSPREREVLEALVAGASNKVIAFDLGLSVRTVEVHRARMMNRLGTRQLAEAIRLGVLATLAPAPRRISEE